MASIIQPSGTSARPPIKKGTVVAGIILILVMVGIGATLSKRSQPVQEEPVEPEKTGLREQAGKPKEIEKEISAAAPAPQPAITAFPASIGTNSAGTQPSPLPSSVRIDPARSGVGSGAATNGGGVAGGEVFTEGTSANSARNELLARGDSAKVILMDSSEAPQPGSRGGARGSLTDSSAADMGKTPEELESEIRRSVNNDPTQRALRELAASQSGSPQIQVGQKSPQQKNVDWMREVGATRTSDAIRPERIEAGTLVLHQGKVIPAILMRNLNSDLPGEVVAVVSSDVYDSIRGDIPLIPKGSQFIGAYGSETHIGQERLMFAFTRLILPGGVSYTLPGSVGMDQSGAAGLAANVNNHFFKMFASAVFIALLANKVEKNDTAASTTVVGAGAQVSGAKSAAGQVLVDVSRSILDRNRAIPATLTVPAGTRINVQVSRDMIFSPEYVREVFKR